MKIVLLFTLLFTLHSQAQNPFAPAKYDRVVIYDFEPRGEKGGSIVENGKLTTTIYQQAELKKSTIDTLNRKLANKQSFHWSTAACYDPYLGIVYYKGNKIVGYINICLGCNRLYASVDLPAQHSSKKQEYDASGMGKSFRQFLNNLLKRYGFPHQVAPGSGFDE